MGTIERALITGRIAEEVAARVRSRSDLEVRTAAGDEIGRDDLEWADVYVGFRPPDAAPLEGVGWVHALGAGVDAFLSGALSAGTVLTRTTGCFGTAIAEYALGHVLAHLGHHARFREEQRRARWEPRAPRPLRGRGVAVLGIGDVGRVVGATFRAIGCRTVGVGRTGRPVDGFDRVIGTAGDPLWRRRLGDVDWIVATWPLTPETHGAIDAELLGAARTGFVNVGRGRLVDEGALLSALGAGRLETAILDVFAEEPLPASSPLWAHPRVVVTPHVAALTDPADAADRFLDAVEAMRLGRRPPGRVDPERGY